MMRLHMLIEVDHLSERARDRVLALTAGHHYPVVSGHTGTGGAWAASELRRLYAAGGIATATPEAAPGLARKLLGFRRFRHVLGVPLGSDVGGFASLPGPRTTGAPLRYPFTSHLGHVTFRRQRTGTRVFDLNRDGVAHYGLIADLVADLGRQPQGRKALDLLFHSAEAYLRTWQRAQAHG